ncbi:MULTISPECIES: gamma-glutamylcyclotransferase family protein [unclassified Ruegeria]|uniref:gamma-glutamylcyclotransferase family protein n=1 Tax=unclassified Ruegeria TaxID=2625375 RepID=UPI001ADBBFEE|nr:MULTISPECIES: gamma-glutamylcyclotransferase family protein [unclassified Ruegeria]MBO9411478.1 gamma-glutamylcyclotransferase [Ruegeria sp. R8_1]MBO9415960.1 gamma-glutamylcyclotransferase [Ruegeria sp. R8_2]
MADPYFFGYGSLVNLATHDFPGARPARLKGWRRAWRHTDLRPVAFLTAIPDPDSEIEGMIAHVPRNDWAALDEREWAYDRVPATQAVTHPLTHDVEIAVYAVPHGRHAEPTNCHPLLLSYIDVVVQGYLRAFGEAGADRFFATTDGWDAPILNDRAEPRYPRHQQLKPNETEFVDTRLQHLSAKLVHSL